MTNGQFRLVEISANLRVASVGWLMVVVTMVVVMIYPLSWNPCSRSDEVIPVWVARTTDVTTAPGDAADGSVPGDKGKIPVHGFDYDANILEVRLET